VSEALLSVRNLRVSFDAEPERVQAVDQVSFELQAGETAGLVGESGSGKSVTALAILGLLPTPGARVESGEAWYGGQNLLASPPRHLARLRGKELSIVFQDPMTSLNPFLTVGRQVTEVFEIHAALSPSDARLAAVRALGDVGIAAPEERLGQYPHELSGGLRQRVMIAIALALRPRILFADEPTTALDVTIQAQIIDLLRLLQEEHGTAIVLISHDLGVVAGIADRVHVMYAGRLVESAATTELFDHPLHPYTQGLLSSVPTLEHDPTTALPTIDGQPPDAVDLTGSCSFAPRCPLAHERCRNEQPPFEAVPPPPESGRTLPIGGRKSACFEVARLRDAHNESSSPRREEEPRP